MKELTTYNRVAGYLNKVFDLLNARFFENALSRPTITIQSTPRAYGHFSLREDTWVSKLGGTHEINIGAGTLARPIEEVAATLLHEMVHYYNYENGVQDCSRGNTYHNRKFKSAAEAHGLTVSHSEKYGWSHTEPSEALIDFIIETGLTDILINRNEFSGFRITGTNTGNRHTGADEQHEKVCLPLLWKFRPGNKDCQYCLSGLQPANGIGRIEGQTAEDKRRKAGEKSPPLP